MQSVISEIPQNFNILASPNHTNFHIRILAGITSGALAITCFQPTDVVKTRLQAQTSGKKRYRGAVHAYMTIATQERITGLWKGEDLV